MASVVGAVALAVLAWVGWRWWSAPAPPAVDLAGADPDVAAAVEEARAVVRAEPYSAAAWGRLGMVLRVHDYGREANVALAEAERLAPADPRWPYLQGLTLLLSDPDAGIEKVRRAVALCDRSEAAPRLRLAEALVARGRTDEAEAEFRAVLDREPANPRASLGVGRLAVLRDELREGLPLLRAARGSNLTRKAASQLLAEVYSRLGDDAALRDLGDVAALPDDPAWPDPFVLEALRFEVGPRAAISRAKALSQQGDDQGAVAVLQEVLARRPDSNQLRLALGWALFKANDLPGAERTLRAAVDAEPGSVEGWFQLGVTLYLRGDRGDAVRAFRKTVALKPDHADAHFNIGQCLKEQGDRAGAEEEFRAALRSRPDHLLAKKALEK